MSSKIKSVWICSECGYESLKWNGQCPACGEWNTFSEEIKDTSKQTTMSYQKSGVYEKPILLNQIKNDDEKKPVVGMYFSLCSRGLCTGRSGIDAC